MGLVARTGPGMACDAAMKPKNGELVGNDSMMVQKSDALAHSSFAQTRSYGGRFILNLFDEQEFPWCRGYPMLPGGRAPTGRAPGGRGLGGIEGWIPAPLEEKVNFNVAIPCNSRCKYYKNLNLVQKTFPGSPIVWLTRLEWVWPRSLGASFLGKVSAFTEAWARFGWSTVLEAASAWQSNSAMKLSSCVMASSAASFIVSIYNIYIYIYVCIYMCKYMNYIYIPCL